MAYRFQNNSAMFIKTLVIVVFLAIIVSLGSALFHLVRRPDGEQSQKTARALTFRIGLSLVLIIFLIIATATGLLQPHGIGARMQQDHTESAGIGSGK